MGERGPQQHRCLLQPEAPRPGDTGLVNALGEALTLRDRAAAIRGDTTWPFLQEGSSGRPGAPGSHSWFHSSNNGGPAAGLNGAGIGQGFPSPRRSPIHLHGHPTANGPAPARRAGGRQHARVSQRPPRSTSLGNYARLAETMAAMCTLSAVKLHVQNPGVRDYSAISKVSSVSGSEPGRCCLVTFHVGNGMLLRPSGPGWPGAGGPQVMETMSAFILLPRTKAS